MKTDFFITYHHNDELAARWIAGVLKDVPFSILMESWDFLPGNQPLEKIEHMTSISRSVLVLLSERFLQAGLDAKSWQFLKAADSTCHVVRIDSCDVEKALGAVTYTDLFGIKEAEARKRLLTAVGVPTADKKEPEPFPVTAITRDEVLQKRKTELEELLKTTIKHQYHMKLDLEQEIEKEVEIEDEKTGKKEKRKQWVWEAVKLETVLTDRNDYILVNPSGMGKTTSLTHVACVLLDCAGDYPFVPLFNTCIALNNREGSIANFIHQRVESFYNNSQTAVVHGEWQNLCLLLDALDQSRDVDDIVSSLQLHDKYNYYKKAKILLSSRQNTADKVKQGFRKIRLKLPEEDEVRHYLGEENYKQLEGHIAASRELVTVPVLLEMLKTITEKGYKISKLQSRSDLYTEFTKLLIDQERSKPRFWQDPLTIRHFIDNELEQVLENIAFFSLVENRILEIEKDKLLKYCETLEKKEALLNIGIILELFEDREQMIVFRHQSFQAYFAARYIYFRQPELFEKLTGDIAFFYHDVWYEVMRFFVGMEQDPQRAENIIELLFKQKFLGIQNPFYKKGFGRRRLFWKMNLVDSLKLIFAVFLVSESLLSIKKVQDLHEQLRFLFTNANKYWDFFILNIDKFNQGNDEQRRILFITFVALLRDKDYEVHHTAVEALKKIGTANDTPLLIPLLRDKNCWIRESATNVLGNIGTANEIPLLLPLFRDEVEWVRRAAAQALGKIGTVNDIPLLVPLLKDKDYWPRSAAAETLKKIIKSNDLPLLLPLLRDEDANVRSAAAETLEKIIKSNDLPLLLPLLRDEDANVRSAAAQALGKIGTVNDIPLLEPLLRDRHWLGRKAAAQALGTIGTVNDIPLLEPLIRDEEWPVRSSTAEALGKIGTSDHIPLLEPLLRDKEHWVRNPAAEALGEIITVNDLPLLGPLLRHEDEEVRCAAAQTLGKIGTSDHIPLLELLIRDEEWYVRSAAAEALGKIVSVKDIPLLEPLLRDEYEGIRWTAAEAIGKIGTSDHIPLLESLLRDKDSDVRIHAAEALGKIGTSDHIPHLEPLLRNKYDWARRIVVEAIEQILKRSSTQLAIDESLTKIEEKETLFVKTAPNKPLHILHISDIHYALEKDPTINCIFHEFLQDIQKWCAQQNNEKIHSICLTGDIAQSGQKNQYESINEKINAILKTTGCSKDQLFIIPGNHDFQEYDKISPGGKTILEQVRENKMNIDTGVLSNFENYHEFHEKFNHYYEFVETSGYHNSLPLTDKRSNSPKPWYSRELQDFPVRIIGLNSALFCLKEFSEYGKIRMGTHQFHEAFFQGKPGNIPKDELVILLTHHPVNWLAENEYEDYTTLMERYGIIHLHGHIHRTKIRKLFSIAGSSYISVGTGSLYGEKGLGDINTYHIITLDFKKEEVHIWARRWIPERGCWGVYDNDINNTFPFPGRHH